AWGCEVTAFTSTEAKMAEAKQMGAHCTIDSHDKSKIKSVAGKFDLIMSTVNVKLDWDGYVETLRQKGRIHFLGVQPDPLNIGMVPMLFKQLSISSSLVGSPGTIATMLDFAVQHDIKPVIESCCATKPFCLREFPAPENIMNWNICAYVIEYSGNTESIKQA
ncbi:MAG: zinc-binding dehydrogenase, partial [Planctomycetota bacterium]